MKRIYIEYDESKDGELHLEVRDCTVLYTCDLIEALVDIDERVAAVVDAICKTDL